MSSTNYVASLEPRARLRSWILWVPTISITIISLVYITIIIYHHIYMHHNISLVCCTCCRGYDRGGGDCFSVSTTNTGVTLTVQRLPVLREELVCLYWLLLSLYLSVVMMLVNHIRADRRRRLAV